MDLDEDRSAELSTPWQQTGDVLIARKVTSSIIGQVSHMLICWFLGILTDRKTSKMN